MTRFLWLLTAVFLTSCLAQPQPLPTAVVADTPQPIIPTATSVPIATLVSTATAVVPTPTPQPTATQTAVPSPTIVATVVATTTPHPLFPYTIASLRTRSFAGGEIRIRTTLEQTAAYTRNYIDYPSDGLTITGIMHTPSGTPPFPVLILLHGYYDRDRYYAGAGTWQAADFFARQGYLVLAPDLRSWGESDSGLSLFHTGLVADVLNLISSLPSLAEADTANIGLWGHSMGGGIATKVLAVDKRVKTAVLYAPNSADDADLIARWGAGCVAGQEETTVVPCNPAEIIPADTPPHIVAAYLAAAANPTFLRQVAPLYHLDAITAPIQIHIGTADGQSLAETPPDWSAKLATALQANNHEADYFIYEGQGHFFTGQSWVTLLDRALAFYDATLVAAP